MNWQILLCGLLFFAMNLTYVSSLTFTSAANAIFLQYTAPLWVLLGGYFLLNEKISRSSLLGILVSSLGVLFILFSRGSWDALLGCILAGVSGFCFGGVSLLLRSLRDANERTLTFFLHFVAAIGLVPFFLVLPDFGPLIVPVDAFPLLAAFGIFQMAIPYLLFAHGLKSVPASEAAAITFLEPVLNPVIAYLVAGDIPDIATVLGGSIVLFGIIVSQLTH